MNSSSRNTTTTTTSSFNSYQFDFGIGAGAGGRSSRPLRDSKANPTTATTSKPSSTWTHQPSPSPSPSLSRPSWTHQPSPAATGSSNPTSMVGDIFGKSWSSSTTTSTNLGIPQSNNPNLFSDLLGSALGATGRTPSNAPLKSAGSKSSAAGAAFSMNNLGNSLPKSAATTAAPATGTNPMGGIGVGVGVGIGSRPMKSAAGPAMNAAPIGQKRDPFSSLDPFAAPKPAMSTPPKPASSTNMGSGSGLDHGFGVFQGANLGSGGGFQSANLGSGGGFQSANSTKFDDFGVKGASFTSPPPPPSQPVQASAKSGVDPLDMLFSSTVPATPAPSAEAANGGGTEMFGEMNDWDVGAEFGGSDGGGTTTELEGLPPPPAGLTVSTAKAKGMDNYKGGQYADAIKWLSWAIVLIEKTGDDAAIVEVLSSRASSYKEVGEYKKAIADCSKVLEQDKENVPVLLQRALFYESTEKYRLGADDLRLVLKIDPGNRLARSTIHRLNKLAD